MIEATEKAALDQLPKKKKTIKFDAKNNHTISAARENLKSASLLFHTKPTRKRKANLESAKGILDEAYLEEEIAFINDTINSMSQHFVGNAHRDAWKLVKTLSGKDSKPKIQLKGGSPKNV